MLSFDKSDKLVRKEQVRSEVRTQNMLFYGNQLGNHTKYLPFLKLDSNAYRLAYWTKILIFMCNQYCYT